MFLNDDDMVECPYDKTHQMLRKRLQSHLLKCRVNHPDVELLKCPFNITHLIPEPEFTHHATNCPDRKLITQYKYDAPEPNEEEVPRHAPIECDEDWDDTDVNDYNPKIYLEKSNVIKKPDDEKRRPLDVSDNTREKITDNQNSNDIPNFNSYKHDRERNNNEKEFGRMPQGSKSYSMEYTDGYSREKYSNSSTVPFSMERSRSPTSYTKQRSRYQPYSNGRSSPNNAYNCDRSLSRSHASYKTTCRGNQFPRRGSPDYSRRYSPPPDSVRRNLYFYNSDRDPYYNGGGSDNWRW